MENLPASPVPVFENVTSGTLVFTCSAVDPDLPSLPRAQLTYQITGKIGNKQTGEQASTQIDSSPLLSHTHTFPNVVDSVQVERILIFLPVYTADEDSKKKSQQQQKFTTL